LIMPTPSILVAGAGFMGHGIAQTAAVAGCNVQLYDLNREALQGALERIRWSLEKFRQKQPAPSPDPEEVLARISLAEELESASRVAFVIEAIAENAARKEDLFRCLHAISPKETVFCSNTSAIPISKLGAASGRPDRFCGMHFFSPVPLMSLVEVIRGTHASDQTVLRVMQLARDFKKEPIEVHRDVPGFIVNRLLLASVLEAIRLLEAGVADAPTIDKAMRLGCGHKMGPLEVADMAGLDVILNAVDAINEATLDAKYEAPLLLRKLVQAGHLGRKSGRGFYLPT